MKRMVGMGEGGGKERRILCMVGVAVYQVALCAAKSFQKEGARRGGMMTALPALRVAMKEATRPWTWKRGMMIMVRSSLVRL